MDVKHELGRDSELIKGKSKSPSLLGEHEAKRARLEPEEADKSEDIAKQYKKFVAAPKFNLDSEELFCICRKPDIDGEMMISCDGCEEWFHTKCMRIDPEYTQLLDKFFCKFCQWKGKGVTRWSRVCRMSGCLQPIRASEHSKYCSDECGKAFLQQAISRSQTLTLNDFTFVVGYCNTLSDLKAMGSVFPELPEVSSLDLKHLPAQVQNVLTGIDSKQRDVRLQLAQSQYKTRYLARVKEMITIINEKVQALSAPSQAQEALSKSKKKKKGSKKADLCCFQERFGSDSVHLAEEDAFFDMDVREAFEKEINKAVEHFEASTDTQPTKMCLEDRRKCLRHNGWFNLLSDRFWKRSVELQAVLERLEHEKHSELRNYSISVYEREE